MPESLISLFIIFPLGALLVGALYLRLFIKRRVWSSLIAALLWAGYACYETLFYLRILCSGECNIRVDLLLIYPLLLCCSLLASGLYYWHGWRDSKKR